MYVAGASMAHAQQPVLLDMLPVCIASDPQRAQSHGLLSAFLARRAEWEALKCIRFPHTLPLLLLFQSCFTSIACQLCELSQP